MRSALIPHGYGNQKELRVFEGPVLQMVDVSTVEGQNAVWGLKRLVDGIELVFGAYPTFAGVYLADGELLQ